MRRHSRPRRRPGVTVHESLAYDLAAPRVRWGVPTVGPAGVLLDLAGIGCDELVLLRALDETRRLRLASWPTLWGTFVLRAKAPNTGASERRNGIPARTQPPEGPP